MSSDAIPAPLNAEISSALAKVPQHPATPQNRLAGGGVQPSNGEGAAQVMAAKNAAAEENAKELFTSILSVAIGLLASAASEGAIDSSKTDAVLGYIFGQTGLKPKSEHEVVVAKLDEALKKLDDLKEGQSKLGEFMAEAALIDSITNVCLVSSQRIVSHFTDQRESYFRLVTPFNTYGMNSTPLSRWVFFGSNWLPLMFLSNPTSCLEQ